MQEAIEERYTKKVKKSCNAMTRRPTECAGHLLKGGTFGEYAGCGPECAACKLNVPGVRMYNDEGLDIFYEGDKKHNPVVHGWIQRDIENNHCAESLAQIRDHPNTTMLAVILTSYRTTREGGADAISDALENHGWINTGDKTRVLTPTPAMGSSANVAIHPTHLTTDGPSQPWLGHPIWTNSKYRDKKKKALFSTATSRVPTREGRI
ncbi:hypothetical protein B0H13DRAFT_1883740 [Mycena leptocephala]|nr:hypothetical protein B0H13DRAFT_1883740 [Mycena leptocephala]